MIQIVRLKMYMWLIRFAYRHLRVAQPTLPTGIPGIRDPEAPCTGYAPRKRNAGDALPTCETDGHFLCKECCFRNPNPSEEWTTM